MPVKKSIEDANIISQGKLLGENMLSLGSNNYNILYQSGKLAKNIISSPAPCKISKSITNKVCGIRSKNNTNTSSFVKIKELVDKTLLSTTKIDNKINKSELNKINRDMNTINKLNEQNINTSLSCHIAKFYTHQVCSLGELISNVVEGDVKIGFINFNKIRDSINSTIELTKKMIKLNKPSLVGGYISKLRKQLNNIQVANLTAQKKLTSNTTVQKGGDNYQYIINPATNRRVSVYGAIGKKILEQY